MGFTTYPGDVVLVLVGGQGAGFLTASGVPLTTLENQTYSETNADQFASAAIFSASLAGGSYVANFASTTSTKSLGTSLGAVAYILQPTNISTSAMPATSVTVSPDASDYLYVGSTAGGSPVKTATWAEDLGVTAAYSGNKSVSIGQSSNNTGSYQTGAKNYAIAGAGVTGYAVVASIRQQTSQVGPGNSHGGSQLVPGSALNLPFTTSTGDVVLIVVGGQGTGYLTLSGVPATSLQNQTYSQGNFAEFASAAIYSATLSSGSYVASLSSTTSLNNGGTSLGAVAYILQPTSISTAIADNTTITLQPGGSSYLFVGSTAEDAR